VDAPCFTLLASMDKIPPYLVTTEEGFVAIEVYDTDSEYMRKIKEFMAMYGIVDIKMRMLKINELLKIQGFPDGYVLKGTQANQKKFIGNSVVPLVAQRMAEALAAGLYTPKTEAA
jgi:DNA (cytosine-5)-methyltransferase 1